MIRPRFIGLGYIARSGKDSVASVLESQHGYKRRAFADPLKEGAARLFGLTGSQLHGVDKETPDPFWGVTPRNLLQRLGTEAMRSTFGEDFWIRALRRHVDICFERTGLSWDWVIPDVRFRNEAEAVLSWGGEVWRVDRPGAGATGGVAGHASERDLDGWEGWSRVIVNDGKLEDLDAKVREALR